MRQNMTMLFRTQLDLQRCPHCNVDMPSLVFVTEFETVNLSGQGKRYWRIYRCLRCGGAVTAWALAYDHPVAEIYPSSNAISDTIPEKDRAFLEQSRNSLSSPAGAVMLAASAVDAMLKAKNLKDG